MFQTEEHYRIPEKNPNEMGINNIWQRVQRNGHKDSHQIWK